MADSEGGKSALERRFAFRDSRERQDRSWATRKSYVKEDGVLLMKVKNIVVNYGQRCRTQEGTIRAQGKEGHGGRRRRALKQKIASCFRGGVVRTGPFSRRCREKRPITYLKGKSN